jgi:hypothetical protein
MKHVEFTLMDFNPKDFSYTKSQRKWRIPLETLQQAELREDEGHFSIHLGSRGWYAVAENPWEVLAQQTQPLPPEPGGKIVEAFLAHEKACGFELSLSFKKLMQAVQSETNALRRLFRNHEKRLKELERCDSNAGQHLGRHQIWIKEMQEELDTLRSMVKGLKVAQLVAEDQAPVARDKDGHVLITGESVVRLWDKEVNSLFMGRAKDGTATIFRGDSECGYYGSGLWRVSFSDLTWVRDLDIPEDK